MEIGSRWWAWGHHWEVVALTTVDGEPAVQLRRQDGATPVPMIARMLETHGIPMNQPTEGGHTMAGAALSKQDQASGKSRAAKSTTSKPKAETSTDTKKVSAREAAIRVMKKAGEPMAAKDIVAKAAKIATDLKDPHAIQVALVTGVKKGKDFKRVDKGVYALIDG